MGQPGPPREGATHGRPLAGDDRVAVLGAISEGLVALVGEFYGREPVRAKSYYLGDLVVCVLRGGFSRVEQVLLDRGRGSAVIEQRMEFQESMRTRFVAVVEAATGQRVIGLVNGNQLSPEMMSEVFILEAPDRTDLGGATS